MISPVKGPEGKILAFDWAQEEECSERLYRAMCLNKVGDPHTNHDTSQVSSVDIMPIYMHDVLQIIKELLKTKDPQTSIKSELES